MKLFSVPKILNVVLLIILLFALGLSSTAFGLFAHNNVGDFCILKYTLGNNGNNGDTKLCNTSFAGYIIASICAAAATLMEFNKLVTGKAANIVGRIIQIVLLAISGVLLLICGITVAIGMAQTCKNTINYNNLNNPVPCNSRFDGYYLPSILYEEMVGSAVCAFLSMIFIIIAAVVAIFSAILSRNNLEEEKPY